MPSFSTALEESYPFPDDSGGAAPAPLRALAHLLNPLRRRIDLARTVLVCDFEPPRSMLERRLRGLPAWIAMPCAPRNPLLGVRYTQLLTDRNPFGWGADLDDAIPRDIDSVATFFAWNQMYGQTLRHWRRLGLKRAWFLRGRPSTVLPLRLGAAYKVVQRIAAKRKATTEETGKPTSEWHNLYRHTVTPARGLPRIVHYTGWLNSGGAERQLCNLARLQKAAGHDVRVFTQAPLVGRAGHYRGLLDEVQIEARHAGAIWQKTPPFADSQLRLLAALPRDLRTPVIDLASELLLDRPAVLHCWLDEPNIIGLVAARLSGVPAVVLSTRNVSPRHLPHLGKPWMQAWYREAAQQHGVALINNSIAGARDYEDWIGALKNSIGVIRNAFQPPRRPSEEEVASFRKEMGIHVGDPVIAGVFRLDPEKRPLLFVDIVEVVRRRLPNLRVLWAGCGSLEGAVRAEINKRGLGNTITLLGQRDDVPTILAASDVTLLVSEAEGTPNVVLEAQYLGSVPIATEVGGAGEAMARHTGLLIHKDDGHGLVRAVEELLGNPARRQEMAQAGRDWVTRQFAPETVARQTLNLYTQLQVPPDILVV